MMRIVLIGLHCNLFKIAFMVLLRLNSSKVLINPGPLQHSGLENPHGEGNLVAAVQRVAKSQM